MRLSACIAIQADGTLLRDVTITVIDGVITDISDGRDHDAVAYAVLTPMFHNGHSHTEYQLLEGILPSGPFFPWVRNVVRLKLSLPSRLWAFSTFYGVTKLLEMGYASTEDCSDSGYAAAIMAASGLRGTSYREVNGLDPVVDPARCATILDVIHQSNESVSVGVAPHAIYSTCDAVLDVLLERAESLPVCIHVDESLDEDQFCRLDSGPFSEMYKRRGIVRRSPRSSAVKYFDNLGLVTQSTLLVHGCNWTIDDIALVRERGSRVAICPESNQYLYCKHPPIEMLYQNEIPTVIGTDSALSCPSMSPINQLYLLMNTSSDTNFHRWLFHALVTPETGQSYDLKAGCLADFCAFGRETSIPGENLYQTIVQILDVSPDVFRSGTLVHYRYDARLQTNLVNVVQELAKT